MDQSERAPVRNYRHARMISLPKHGLDSRKSWLVALLCGLVHLFCSLSMAAMGSMFTGFLIDFSSEREKASWPVTSITCSMQIVSPLFSILVHLGARHEWILRICTFTVSAALVLSYFAKTIVFITSMQETIAGVSVFFMPALMDNFIRRFRTVRSISLLGVITFASFIFSLCITPFNEQETQDSFRNGTQEDTEHVEFPKEISSTVYATETSKDASEISQNASSAVDSNNLLTDQPVVRDEPKPFSWRTFTNLRYFFDVFSFLVVFECFATFLQLTADYSNDREVPEGAIYLVPIFGIGDMMFKLGSGFLSDAKIASPPTLMLAGSVIQCFSFVLLSYSSTMVGLSFSAFLMGTSNGCRIILFIIVLINDFGLDNLSHTFSFANFLIGIATLLKPFLVGYFRDRLGEYLGLFLLLATLNAVVAFYWAVRVIEAYRNKRITLT
ncbi:uncharacterized protein LOC111243256 isoform X3 [Varroa destructor]|uniref:Monocarboxylate transporter n=1 Tax=Varroa destructor TaxID=109461 RepID=A0A7M7J0D2_VARDE|nr:uncharacterized protein LOC111243256 isoform X3 [Varroa destructor]